MERTFDFYGSMPRNVLNSYLSRAVTHFGIGYDNLATSRTVEDDLRMLKREGAKFIGRAALIWSQSQPIEEHFRHCKARAELAHQVDPQFILQACVFECIGKEQVEAVPVPAYVFEAFGLEPEIRNFSYNAMLFPDGSWVNHWGKDASVEDITQLESRLWIYYLATAYIDAGYEGIHFGQVCLIGRDDPDFRYWREVILKIREYALAHGRRRYVLFDAHTLGDLRQNEELFDYNAFPIRLKDVPEGPQFECVCEEGYLDSMFNPKDGLCRPFIVEFDNWGKRSPEELGKPHENDFHAWGYDEITWFTRLSPERRAKFLHYIWDWVNARYPEGWVQMPSRRCLVDTVEFVWEQPDLAWLEQNAKDEFLTYTVDDRGAAQITRRYYSANTPSAACPFGMGDEDAITDIFHQEI